MNASIRLGILALTLATLAALPAVARADDATTKPAASAAEIKALITQLGDNSVKKREAAFGRLQAIGAPALAELRAAADSKDPEIANRAKLLVEDISKAIEKCLAWKFQTSGRVSPSIVMAKGLVMFSCGDSQVYAIGPDGHQRWTFNSALKSEPPMLRVWGDNLLMYSPNQRLLQLISIAKGQEIWQTHGMTVVDCHVAGDVMACLDSTGCIVGIAAKDGKEAYKTKVADLVKNAKTGQIDEIRSDGDVTLLRLTYIDNDSIGRVAIAAIKSGTGKKIWAVEEKMIMVQGITAAEGKLYALLITTGRGQANFVATFDIKSGKESDTGIKIEVDLIRSGAGLIGEGKLISSSTTRIVAFDLKSGKEAWSYDLGTPPMLGGGGSGGVGPGFTPRRTAAAGIPMAIDNGRLIVGSFDGLIALDMKTGTKLWKYPLPLAVVAGPVVLDGKAYFATGYGDQPPDPKGPKACLYCLDLAKAKSLDLPTEQPAGNRSKR